MREISPPGKTVEAGSDVVSSGEAVLGLPRQALDFSSRNQQLAALIKGVASGDDDALAALYDATRRLLYGLTLRILGNAESAEEVLLDVYKQVWRKASSYDLERGNPLAWLMTIARSRAIDRLRADKQERQRVDALDTARGVMMAGDIEKDAALSEMRRVILAALESLPPEQREVIDLAYYGGLSQSEIATKLGQPLGTVKTRARLAMMKLREKLRPISKETR
jgi:RNA polymerase sigma-70 factor, ECF subfamily